uniref:Transthyretin-like protein 5 n=1 Tax=Parascaris univalens TaxID=6257 RepID=A0A914ZX87_PARUN
MIGIVLLISILPFTFGALGGMIGRTQSVGATGILLCNGQPAADVLVKMYDDDRGFDFDDFMGETTTDSQGRFELSGSNAEVSSIDPKINIYHDCEDWWWPCQRKISIMIPDVYITPGTRPRNFYDAGTIELAGKYAGEERDCIH